MVYTFAPPVQVYAKDISSTLPRLNTFIDTVKNGNSGELRGIYIPNLMALNIVQQPVGDPGYVSTAASVATQFGIAAEVGNIGLLAHNTLAGSLFSDIKQGKLIILIYGDGHIESFMTKSIQRYQAMEPLSPYSHFKNLETQSSFSAEELFNNIYRGEHHLVLQTCIENNGNTSWGRLFIVATPIGNNNIIQNGKYLNALGPFANK